MTLTVGIVNYNTKEHLKRCIHSILDNPPKFDYNIIVVDNHSNDGSKEFLKSLNKKVISYILNKDNRGYGSACNQISKKSLSDYLLFLNSDVIASKGAIDKLLSFMEEHKEVAVSTGRLFYPDGTLQLPCRSFPTILRTVFGRESLLRKIFPKNPISKEYLLTDLDYNRVQFPDWVRGAVMLCRSECFNEINGFDEIFFLYLEDTDLCLRLRKRGYKIAYLPDAHFYHSLGTSTRKEELKTKLIHNISMFHYARKNLGYNHFLLFFILLALFLRISFLIGSWIIKRMRL